jgi:hypothetical protein
MPVKPKFCLQLKKNEQLDRFLADNVVTRSKYQSKFMR